MKPRQTHLDTGTAVEPSIGACDDVFANRKTHTDAVVGSPIDADRAKSVVDKRAVPAALCDPKTNGIDAFLRTGAAAGRISAATLAAARRVSSFHADARAACAVQPMRAGLGVDRGSGSMAAEEAA